LLSKKRQQASVGPGKRGKEKAYLTPKGGTKKKWGKGGEGKHGVLDSGIKKRKRITKVSPVMLHIGLLLSVGRRRNGVWRGKAKKGKVAIRPPGDKRRTENFFKKQKLSNLNVRQQEQKKCRAANSKSWLKK